MWLCDTVEHWMQRKANSNREKLLIHSDTDQQEGGEKQKTALLSNEVLEDSRWGV